MSRNLYLVNLFDTLQEKASDHLLYKKWQQMLNIAIGLKSTFYSKNSCRWGRECDRYNGYYFIEYFCNSFE